MFICSMVLRCTGTLKLESGPVTVDLTTTVVHSYKLPRNDFIPLQSLSKVLNDHTEKHRMQGTPNALLYK